MKRSIRIAALSLILWGMCQTCTAAELTVRLDNPPPEGNVAFVLFDSANAFGDLRDPVKLVIAPLDGRDLYRVEGVPAGEYALLVYYDENDNGKIDKNFIGIPKEPLGFSNRYKPKGPPSFSRAAFTLTEDETRHFDVSLYRPLGKRGRLGIGVGVVARSSPYKGYNGAVSQVIPAITYTGSRLQIFGPSANLSLVGSGKLRLAATGTYRIGVYEEDESDFLEGMGDREETFMAGLSFQAELPGGIDFSARYEHDVLDRIGGGTVQTGLSKSFQAGIFRFSPSASVNWLSDSLSTHDFGVPDENATPQRPAYDPGDTVSTEAGLGVFVEITRSWMIIANTSVEFLGSSATDSPIVSDDYVIKGFGAINYVF